MKIEISIDANIPNIRILKPWGTEMEPWGYSTSIRLVNGVRMGQFSHIVPVMLDSNGNQIDGSANSSFSNISSDDWLRIAELQVVDNYTIDQKMKWLTMGGSGEWGAPMRADYSPSSDWRNAQNIDLIGGMWARQKVEIIESRVLPSIQYNNMLFNSPTLHRIRTFQTSDWNKTYFTHPWLVQKVTAVSSDDKPLEPQGVVYLPLILTRAASCWVFSSWLE